MPKKNRGKRIKSPKNRDIINLNYPGFVCGQDEDDILIEFGHITQHSNYSYNALEETNKTDTKAIDKLMKLLVLISSSTWTELSHRNKKHLGGFETLSLSDFKAYVWEQLPILLSEDVKLYVFRFGNEDKYRMIGYKSSHCRRVLHILAFDLDFSLYDHG